MKSEKDKNDLAKRIKKMGDKTKEIYDFLNKKIDKLSLEVEYLKEKFKDKDIDKSKDKDKN